MGYKRSHLLNICQVNKGKTQTDNLTIYKYLEKTKINHSNKNVVTNYTLVPRSRS